jgi:LysM repeat protein
MKFCNGLLGMGLCALVLVLGETGCTSMLKRHRIDSGSSYYSRTVLTGFEDDSGEKLRAKPRKPAYESITYKDYVVVKGDSYWKIARRHSVSMNDLLKANDASREDILCVGQKVQIPIRNIPSTVEYYAVTRGDTLSRIARRRGCTIAELYQLNHLSGDTIMVGQQLIVPKLPDHENLTLHPESVSLNSKVVTAGNETYTVRRGDTLSTIAAAHSMTIKEIMDINGILQPDKIREGQLLNVASNRFSSNESRTTTTSTNSKVTGKAASVEDDLLGLFDDDDFFDISN